MWNGQFHFDMRHRHTYMHAYDQGRPSPLRPWCISPCFRFPPISEKFWTFWKILTILPFPEKFLDSHPPKFLMTFFLVIHHKFWTSFLFSLFQYISPCFEKIFLSPLLWQISSPYFRQIHLLFTYFACISFPPYFDHDAFMQHPMHVLHLKMVSFQKYTHLCILNKKFRRWYSQSCARCLRLLNIWNSEPLWF